MFSYFCYNIDAHFVSQHTNVIMSHTHTLIFFMATRSEAFIQGQTTLMEYYQRHFGRYHPSYTYYVCKRDCLYYLKWKCMYVCFLNISSPTLVSVYNASPLRRICENPITMAGIQIYKIDAIMITYHPMQFEQCFEKYLRGSVQLCNQQCFPPVSTHPYKMGGLHHS